MKIMKNIKWFCLSFFNLIFDTNGIIIHFIDLIVQFIRIIQWILNVKIFKLFKVGLCLFCISFISKNILNVSSTLIEFTILSTNDLHSHFEGSGPQINLFQSFGHYARLAYIIRNIQDRNPNATLTLDAGDWFCGSMFSMIGISYLFPDLLPELQFFKYARYDAITIGNHEMIDKNGEFGWIMKKYYDSTINSKEPYFYGIPRSVGHESNLTFQDNSKLNDVYFQKDSIISIQSHESCKLFTISKTMKNDMDRHEIDNIANSIETSGEYLVGNVPILVSNIKFFGKCNHLNKYSSWSQVTLKDFSLSDIKSYNQKTNEKEKSLFFDHIMKKVYNNGVSLNVGIISSYGVNAADISQTTRVDCLSCSGFNDKLRKIEWKNYVEKIFDSAINLRKKGAEFVILLAHEGEPYNTKLIKSLKRLLNARMKKDMNLKYKVAINVIIAAHTHDHYSKKIDDVLITQSGKYGEYLGVLNISYNKDQDETIVLNSATRGYSKNSLFKKKDIEVNLSSNYITSSIRDIPQLLPIDSYIPYDENVLYMIEYYKGIIDNFFLKNMPFNYGDVLGHLDTSIMAQKGDLTQYIANCIHKQISLEPALQLEPEIDVYYMGNALVTYNPNDVLFSRNLTFSDVQRILGYGAMTSHLNSENIWRSFGDRITHFYLSIEDFMKVEEARMYASWIKKKYMFHASTTRIKSSMRTFGIPFYNRLVIKDEHGNPIKSKKLIHVAISQSALVFFKRFKEYSFGIVDPIVRDKFGRPKLEIEIDKQEYVLLAQCIRDGDT